MPEQFIPSNADDGYSFICQHCQYCARDAVSNGTRTFQTATDDELCQILAASFRGEAKEWVEHDDGRTECTAYVPFGQPLPFRDPATIDMFGGAP